MTSADYKTGHADGVSETRQELGREIERLRAELKEARRIARWLRQEWDGPQYDMLTAEQQAWLEAIESWGIAKC